jgi:hypothetical protein
MYFLKYVLGVYFVKNFYVKNSIFCVFLVSKCRKPASFAPFLYILGGIEVLFDFFDSLHHHPASGTPPANSRHQAVYLRVHILYILYIIYIIYYIIYIKIYIIINILHIYIYSGASDYGPSMT